MTLYTSCSSDGTKSIIPLSRANFCHCQPRRPGKLLFGDESIFAEVNKEFQLCSPITQEALAFK
jgi:hypothetical protein